MEYQEPEKFVRKVLADKSSYILNGYSDDLFFQFEYKVQKSEAAKNLELHEKGLVEIPRWVVYFSIPVMIFLIAFFTGALITMTSVKPDAIYGQSCADRSCSKALNLKCINKICQCESPKYYTNKCVDLSKYGETCVSRDNCDPSQDMICFGSICACAPTKYWNSELSKCVDRLTYGQTCNGDQCKIRVNLVCSSIGVCECSDNTLYYWNASANECFNKKKFSFPCLSNEQCLDSLKAICKDQYCLCADTQYFNNTQCIDKGGEFFPCTYDIMCLPPMFCSSSNCTCGTYYFFNASISNCQEQHLPGGPCFSDHHCREDKLLFCDLGVCRCPIGYSWSGSSESCKLTYSNGPCSQSSNCNLDEELICATNTDCNCPDNSTLGTCDCKREVGDEMYWDSSLSKCVATHAYNNSCTSDYQCRTMTEFTNCIDGFCNCKQPGGFASWNRCRTCKDGDYYFNDKCYFFSNSTDIKTRDQAINSCDNVRTGSVLVAIETEAELIFINTTTSLTGYERYWLSGGRTNNGVGLGAANDYNWLPTSNNDVDSTLCSLSNQNCIYFQYGCYQSDLVCTENLRYICEY